MFIVISYSCVILGTTPYGQKALGHFLKPPSQTHDIAKDFA